MWSPVLLATRVENFGQHFHSKLHRLFLNWKLQAARVNTMPDQRDVLQASSTNSQLLKLVFIAISVGYHEELLTKPGAQFMIQLRDLAFRKPYEFHAPRVITQPEHLQIVLGRALVVTQAYEFTIPQEMGRRLVLESLVDEVQPLHDGYARSLLKRWPATHDACRLPSLRLLASSVGVQPHQVSELLRHDMSPLSRLVTKPGHSS